ncbi:MAG: hypothetical protein Q9212_005221 [Teloschistes hypoglaucus]
MAILYINMDNMYYTEALTYTPARFAARPPELDRVFEFRKLVTASLILTWVAMMAVKFSFLALFKRLIDRIPPLVKYWWVVVVFNIAVTVYGAAVYVVACPHFSGAKVGYTDQNEVLYIPFRLIWKVKIKLAQKLSLACSLCLTAIVVIFTITRASGLEWEDKLDVLWEVYFQIVAAEVGLILVALTAFRALFISRASPRAHSPQKHTSHWLNGKLAWVRLLNPRRWALGNMRAMAVSRKRSDGEAGSRVELPNIPRGTMTGMQTFIDQHEVSFMQAGHVSAEPRVI